jgi:hypothetical protein
MTGRQIERQAVMARSKPCKSVSELSADAEYREYCRKWRAANQQKVREYRREYRAANLEKVRKGDRE